MDDVYKKLAIHLDNTPGGYPATKSGVELRILKQLFSKEEALLALSLVLMPEKIDAIALRIKKDPAEIKPLLLEMGVKGLIIHTNIKDIDYFMLAQFVVGIWEFQVNRLTKELIKDFNEYVPFLVKNYNKHETKQLRVVPVGQSVNTELNIMDYDHVANLIESQSKIRVAPCICRKEHEMMDEGCGKLLEACFMFGSGAYLYESRGIGRDISKDEALEIIKKGVEQGLVLQPSNSKQAMNICLCCGCCCQILRNIKEYDAPAKIVHSNFQAFVDQDECSGCQACEEICPMDAIEMDQEKIVANVTLDRCIGCGLCVTACHFDSMTLKDKIDTKTVEPPEKMMETYIKIAQEKGLI